MFKKWLRLEDSLLDEYVVVPPVRAPGSRASSYERYGAEAFTGGFHDHPPAGLASFTTMHGNVLAASSPKGTPIFEMWFRVGDLRSVQESGGGGMAAVALQTFLDGFALNNEQLFPGGLGGTLFDRLPYVDSNKYFALGAPRRAVVDNAQSGALVAFSTQIDEAVRLLSEWQGPRPVDDHVGPRLPSSTSLSGTVPATGVSAEPWLDGTAARDAEVLLGELEQVERKPNFAIIWQIVGQRSAHVREVFGLCQDGQALAPPFSWSIVNLLYDRCRQFANDIDQGDQWFHFEHFLGTAGLVDTAIVTFDSDQDEDVTIASRGTPFVGAELELTIGVKRDSFLGDKLYGVDDGDQVFVSWRVQAATLPKGAPAIDIEVSTPRGAGYTTGHHVKDALYDLHDPTVARDPLSLKHKFDKPGDYCVVAIIVGSDRDPLGGIFAVRRYVRVSDATMAMDAIWDDYEVKGFGTHLAELEQSWRLGLHGSADHAHALVAGLRDGASRPSRHYVCWDGLSNVEPAQPDSRMGSVAPEAAKQRGDDSWRVDDAGGGRFYAENRDGERVRGRWFGWSQREAYWLQSAQALRGTAASFAVPGLKPDTPLVDLSMTGNQEVSDSAYLGTIYPGDYIVVFAPADGDSAALLHRRVVTRQSEAFYDAQHTRARELWNISQFGLHGREDGEGERLDVRGANRYVRTGSGHNPDELESIPSAGTAFLPVKCVLARLSGDDYYVPLFLVRLAHRSLIPETGRDVINQGWYIVDASPGVGRTAYAGRDGTIKGALENFEQDHKHPAGFMRLLWEPAKWGLPGPAIQREFTSDGRSHHEAVAGTTGSVALWGALGGLALTLVNPPVGLLVLTGAGAAAGMSSAAALADNLNQDEVDEWRAVMDGVGLATALLGNVTASQAARSARNLAKVSGKKLTWRNRQYRVSHDKKLINAAAIRTVAHIELAASGVETMLIGADCYLQWQQIEASELSDELKQAMWAGIAAQAAIAGGLYFVSALTHNPQADFPDARPRSRTPEPNNGGDPRLRPSGNPDVDADADSRGGGGQRVATRERDADPAIEARRLARALVQTEIAPVIDSTATITAGALHAVRRQFRWAMRQVEAGAQDAFAQEFVAALGPVDIANASPSCALFLVARKVAADFDQRPLVDALDRAMKRRVSFGSAVDTDLAALSNRRRREISNTRAEITARPYRDGDAEGLQVHRVLALYNAGMLEALLRFGPPGMRTFELASVVQMVPAGHLDADRINTAMNFQRELRRSVSLVSEPRVVADLDAAFYQLALPRHMSGLEFEIRDSDYLSVALETEDGTIGPLTRRRVDGPTKQRLIEDGEMLFNRRFPSSIGGRPNMSALPRWDSLDFDQQDDLVDWAREFSELSETDFRVWVDELVQEHGGGTSVVDRLVQHDYQRRGATSRPDPYPDWVIARARELGFENNPSELPWRELRPLERQRLIRWATTNQDFDLDREIRGLRLASRLSDSFDPRIEHGGPRVSSRGRFFELHATFRGDAGANARQSRQALDQLHPPRPPAVHSHLVVPLPDPADLLGCLEFVDFYRRADMLLTLIRGTHKRLYRRSNGIEVYFNLLTREKLAGILRYTLGLNPVAPTGAKTSAVGFRTDVIYDGASGDGLGIGFEQRYGLTEIDSPELLTDLQSAMVTGNYRADSDRLAGYMDGRTPEQTAEAYANSYYNQDTASLLSSAPTHVSSLLNAPRGNSTVRDFILEDAGENYALRMLVFDWSRDPLVGSNPALLSRIRDEQQRALTALQDPGSRTLPGQQFIRNSGLIDAFAESLGIEPSVATSIADDLRRRD